MSHTSLPDESYLVNGVLYVINSNGIYRENKPINVDPTLDRPARRRLLHSFASSQLRAETSSLKRQLADASSALNKIEGDPFYLGRFLK